jgi:lipoprotein-releasing system ATP-binding protein
MSNIILQCQQVNKNFFDGNNIIKILSGVNLTVTQGQQVAIMGRSGSGKTTLLQLLGGLDKYLFLCLYKLFLNILNKICSIF